MPQNGKQRSKTFKFIAQATAKNRNCSHVGRNSYTLSTELYSPERGELISQSLFLKQEE